MRPLGIVFDLDGTLVLSHHDFRRMRDEVVRTAEEFGIPPGRIQVTERIGTTQTISVARRELEAAGVTAMQMSLFDAEMGRRLDSIELEALPRTGLRAGAEALLKVLRRQGVRLGLFTRSSDAFCVAALARLGLESFFPNVRTRNDPGPVKPSPEALRLLLREMEVLPHQAIFVGDHLEDAECATRAGVRFYGVLPDPEQPNPTTEEGFFSSGATAVATDLRGIARLLGVNVPTTSETD
jgi:phosphoglycolate phosphatase